MAFRTIGQDCAIEIILGPLANGQAISFAAAVSVKAYAKSIEIDEDADKVAVPSLGDGLEKSRYKREKARVRLKLQVPDSGPIIGSGKVGYSILTNVKAISSLSTPEQYVGGIDKRSLAVEDDENIETVEIGIGIEGWNYTGVFA